MSSFFLLFCSLYSLSACRELDRNSMTNTHTHTPDILLYVLTYGPNLFNQQFFFCTKTFLKKIERSFVSFFGWSVFFFGWFSSFFFLLRMFCFGIVLFYSLSTLNFSHINTFIAHSLNFALAQSHRPAFVSFFFSFPIDLVAVCVLLLIFFGKIFYLRLFTWRWKCLVLVLLKMRRFVCDFHRPIGCLFLCHITPTSVIGVVCAISGFFIPFGRRFVI